jgi:hypothetical protein
MIHSKGEKEFEFRVNSKPHSEERINGYLLGFKHLVDDALKSLSQQPKESKSKEKDSCILS